MSVTSRMKNAAYEFERARIDAGFDYAKVESDSADWSLDGKTKLRVFGIDSDNKSHRWEEGIDE